MRNFEPVAKLLAGLLLCVSLTAAENVERWGVYEAVLRGPTSGNPYADTMKLPGKPYLAVRFEAQK